MAVGDLSKVLLSGSVNGRNISVASVGTPGTLVHTAAAAPTIDEITLFACNTSTTAVKLTIEWGGVTVPDDLMEVSIPGESGWLPIVEGHLLTAALTVRAFAATTAVLAINGFVNRIE